MQFSATRALRRVPFSIAILLAAACGSDTGPTEVPDPPQITITGVADNTTYTGPVTIGITVDKGAYDATLDGAPFNAGGVVQAAGAHVLIVNAHESTRTSSRTVHFTIQTPGAPGGALIIRLLDLGTKINQAAPGDAIVLTDSTSAGNVSVVIDAGPAGPSGTDFGYVSRKLAELNIDTVSIMLLTHAHGDHYGGMREVLTSQVVKRFLYSGQVRSSTGYQDVLSLAASRTDSVIVVSDSIRPYTFGYSDTPTQIKFLRPLQTYIHKDTDDGTELNEGSVGARVDLGSFNMFFTGDSEVQATARWRTSYPSLTKDLVVLKVGHHGANNAIFDNGLSGQSTWLDFTSPETSVISASGTTHPRMFALARLQQQPGNNVYCTNTHGMITITVLRSGSYTVSVEKNATLPCQKGTEATT